MNLTGYLCMAANGNGSTDQILEIGALDKGPRPKDEACFCV